MFEHGHSITNSDAECTPGSALADHDRHDGRAQTAHLSQIDRDGLRLTTLFGADPGVGSGRVDETDDWKTVLLGESHFHQRLAVALGMSTAEVAFDLFGCGPSLVVADDQRLHRTDATESRDDRSIISEMPVSAKFAEVTTQKLDVVK